MALDEEAAHHEGREGMIRKDLIPSFVPVVVKCSCTFVANLATSPVAR